MAVKSSVSGIIFEDGKAAKVILDIDKYEEMLERLEDLADLKELKRMREKPLHFRKLSDYLEDRDRNV